MAIQAWTRAESKAVEKRQIQQQEKRHDRFKNSSAKHVSIFTMKSQICSLLVMCSTNLPAKVESCHKDAQVACPLTGIVGVEEPGGMGCLLAPNCFESVPTIDEHESFQLDILAFG